VTGLDALPDLKAPLLKKVPLKTGGVFLEPDWLTAKRALTDGLHEAGYAEATVDGEAVVDLDGAFVDARLEAKPGLRYRIGTLFAPVPVKAVVPAKLIIDVAAGDLLKGAWYSDSALAEAQARVFQMGVFGAVKVNRGSPDNDKQEIPIVIDAREAPLRSFRWGAGAGGDAIRNDVHGFVEYTDRNFGFSRLISRSALLDRLTVKLKGGVAFLPNVYDFIRLAAAGSSGGRAGPFGTLGVQYEVPRVFDTRNVSLQSSLEASRVLDNAFDYLSAETRVGFLWRPRVDLSVYPSVNFNLYSLNSEITQNASTTAPTAALGCPTAPAICLLGFLDITIEWDKRDNRLSPKEGFYLALSAQLGASQTTRFTPYLRFLPEARGYVSFGETRWLTVAGKVRAGTLVALSDGETPIVTRFFSGGSFMRGFNQRRLSPMTVVTTPTEELGPVGERLCARGVNGQCAGTTVPIGGASLLEASLEVRFEVTENLVLAVFWDNGLVSSAPLGPGVDFARDFYSALGFGVRYKTPLGPLRADVAFRLPFVGGPLDTSSNPQNASVPVTSGCFFNLGASGSTTYAGAPDSVCSFHLSIGEAF